MYSVNGEHFVSFLSLRSKKDNLLNLFEKNSGYYFRRGSVIYLYYNFFSRFFYYILIINFKIDKNNYMAYSHLKLLHLLAVVIFLGNIITGLFWMHIAVKTKDLKIISHTIKGIIKADRLFTIPGVIVITVCGLLAAIYANYPILGSGWIFWSIIMFSISGIIFSYKVAPLQKKIYSLTMNKENDSGFDWTQFNKNISNGIYGDYLRLLLH